METAKRWLRLLLLRLGNSSKLDCARLVVSCPKCGRELEESQTDGYLYQCHDCDEDFYEFELLTKNI